MTLRNLLVFLVVVRGGRPLEGMPTMTEEMIDDALNKIDKQNPPKTKEKTELKKLDKADENEKNVPLPQNPPTSPEKIQEKKPETEKSKIQILIKSPSFSRPQILLEHSSDISRVPPVIQPLFILIQVFMAFSGVYLCVFAFKYFRVTMVIFTFNLSYYSIIFILKAAGVLDANSPFQALGVFFLSMTLCMTLLLIHKQYSRSYYIIQGCAVGCVIGVVFAQFFADLSQTIHVVILVVIILFSSAVFCAFSFLMFEYSIIVGGSLVGAILAPLNFSFLSKTLESLESSDEPEKQRTSYYFVSVLLMLVGGILMQLFLKENARRKVEQEQLRAIRGQSYLD